MYDASEREGNDSLMCKILQGEIGGILVWPSPEQKTPNIYDAPESNIDDSLLARVVRGETSEGILYPTPPEKILGNSNNQMSGNKTRLKSVTLKKISTPSKGTYAQEITETYEAIPDDMECVTEENCSAFSVPPSVRSVPANFLLEAPTPVLTRAKETVKNRTSSSNLDPAYSKAMLRNLKKWQEARRKLVLDTTKISTIGPTMCNSSGHSK